jgi:Protein of unknown function (DUF1360)
VTETLTEAKEGRLARYSEEPRPLGSYTATMAILKCGSLGASLIAAQRSRRLPKRIGAGEIVLLGVATHKLSRLIAKDTDTSPLRAPFTRYEGGAGVDEVSETPRGEGPRRALAS